MRLLLILPSVPHPGNRLAGAPNARSAEVLAGLCDSVLAVSPRPWAPRPLRFHPRWRTYAEIPEVSRLGEVDVHRPEALSLPFLGSRAVTEVIRTLAVKRFLAKRTNGNADAVLSFDLLGCGGMAWRLGRHFGVPAAGWAIGSDIRVAPGSPRGRLLAQTIRNLDVVFYQSEELRAIGCALVEADEHSGSKHRVRSRGIVIPDSLPGSDARRAVRKQLGVGEDEVLALSVGRIVRDKGVFDLIGAVARTGLPAGLRLVFLGGVPAYDQTDEFLAVVAASGLPKGSVTVLPACDPADVWRYYAAADIYAFTSFKEGMPNSVLEAMAAGLPVVAFDIPAIASINVGEPVIATAAIGDFGQVVAAVEALARHPAARAAAGERGRRVVRSRFDMQDTMKAVLDDLHALSAASPVAPEA